MATHPVATEASRLDTISGILQAKDIPASVITYAAVPQRPSTAGLYDKQWQAYAQFCSRKAIHPLDSTEATVAEYLVDMFEGGLQPSTIKVHKSAILSVLKHTSPELTESTVIRDCIRRFEIERPRTHRVLPKFDVNLVLWQLLRPPFVDTPAGQSGPPSDRDIPLDIFICKLTFLLALACGSRSSELHAFSRSSGSLTREKKRGGGTILSLRTFPGFLAKNDRPDHLPRPVQVPSMFQLVGPREPERFWCPVRAVDIYLARTQGQEYDSGDSRLLRHPNPRVKTTKGHIALWIRRAITLAYEHAGRGDDAPHVNAHEVRAVAHSLAAYNGASLQDVLAGAGWHGEESFFQHYLRDMSGALAGPAGTAPVVIAGRVGPHTQ